MNTVQEAARASGLTALIALALCAAFTAGYCAWPLLDPIRAQLRTRWQVIRFKRNQRSQRRADRRLAQLKGKPWPRA